MFGMCYKANRNQSVNPVLWHRNGLTLLYTFSE